MASMEALFEGNFVSVVSSYFVSRRGSRLVLSVQLCSSPRVIVSITAQPEYTGECPLASLRGIKVYVVQKLVNCIFWVFFGP